MEINRKMKALNIELEEVSKELPKELDDLKQIRLLRRLGLFRGAFESPEPLSSG